MQERKSPSRNHRQTKPVRVRRPTIYFIRCETSGLVKVGFTTRTPQDRLRESQTFAATPLTLLVDTPGTKAQEKLLHQLLAPTRHHGEWFNPSPALEDLIDSLVEAREGTGGIYSSSTSEQDSFLAEWLAGGLGVS